MHLANFARSRRAMSYLVLGLLVVNVGLGIALAAFAFMPHPFVVTPMVKDSQLVVPGQVPPDAVRRFALHYLYFLDDYTAHTIKDRSNYVLRFISPGFAEKAAKDLTDRLRYAERAREAAQLVTPPPAEIEVTRTGPGLYRASVPAVKRIYIADRLTQESHVRYTLDVKSVLPTEADPYGFVVVGQSVEGRQCLVMDLVDGTSLSNVIRSTNRIESIRALKLVRQVAGGLAYAHKKDIVHRDIKPDNILVDVTDRAVIIDFGITKSFRVEPGADRGLTTIQGTFLGTPHYTSPEQSSGLPVDQRSDIYSLGATLYEMLSGARPYTAPTELALLHQIADLKTLPEPLSKRVPGIDPEVEVLVDRMMAKRSEERFLSCDDVVAAIDRVLTRTEARSASGGRRRLVAAGFAMALGLLGLAAYWVHRHPTATSHLASEPSKGSFLLPHEEKKAPQPPSQDSKPSIPAKDALKPELEIKETPKAKPAEPPKPAPPPYQPTEAELRFLEHVLETVRKTFPERNAYSLSRALADLDSLAQSGDNTPWTTPYVHAERERLNEAARLTARRPLFPTDKELQFVLRDGKILRGRATREDAARVTVLLPSGLSEELALADIAPISLAAAFENPWEAFALRASTGDAAGALSIYAAAPEALSLRIEQGHLPGLVDGAIEEALAAGGRGDLGPFKRLAIPAPLRSKIPPVLGERMARLEVEAEAAALYEKRDEKEARSRLLNDRRTTFAGLRLAGEIMAEFKRDAEKNEDRELVTIPRWATWARDSERAPKATFVCDQETKTYVVTAVDAKDRALIKKKFAGSKQGYEVRLRLEQADAVAVVGISLTRWVELSTNEVRFFSEGALSGSAKIPQESYRFAITILPDAVAGQNLVYVNGNLTFALDSHAHALGGGIILGAGGGAVRVESLIVRNSQVHDDDE